MDIILASTSPRRRALLEQIGLGGFKLSAPQVDEEIDRDMPPGAQVEALSLRKARAVGAKADPDDVIIAADTVVSLEGEVLGKPHSEMDAFKMLSALSGNRHQVYTGMTVLQGERTVTEHEMTTVSFRELEPEEIWAYIATGEPMDKAGAYGIQGVGALLVDRIEGDYYNVMGLPVYRLGRVLAGFGIDVLALASGERTGGDERR